MKEQSECPRDMERRLAGAVALKDYAVQSGLDIPDHIIAAINDSIQEAKRGGCSADLLTRIDGAVRDLTRLTYPTTVGTVLLSVPLPEGSGNRGAVWWLKLCSPILGVAALACAVASHSLLGNHEVYGDLGRSLTAACLGLMGATVYTLFNLTRMLRDKAFDESDVYTNWIRMLLGPLLGWLFYFAFARDPRDGGDALVLVSFLAGFSTKFVIGVIAQALTAAMITLGIEGKDIERLMRRRAGDKLCDGGRNASLGDSG